MTRIATVLFFTSHNWFGDLTEGVTHSKYVHTGIWIPSAGYFEAVDQGVTESVNPPDAPASAKTSITEEGVAFLQGEVGKPYSYTTLAADLADAYISNLGLQIYRAGEYDCSALVAEALGIKDPHLQTPGSLATLLGVS